MQPLADSTSQNFTCPRTMEVVGTCSLADAASCSATVQEFDLIFTHTSGHVSRLQNVPLAQCAELLRALVCCAGDQ